MILIRNRTAVLLIITLAIVATTIFLVFHYLTIVQHKEDSEWLCGYNDDVFVVVYRGIKPNMNTFEHISQALANAIATNSSNSISIKTSLCKVESTKLPSELRGAIERYQIYPVFFIYSSKLDPSIASLINVLFDRYDTKIYIPKKEVISYIYLYLLYSGYTRTYLDLDNIRAIVLVEKKPKVDPELIPIIGSTEARYYMYIYEDVYCIHCAKLYNETISRLWKLVEEGTMAIILKNMVVHSESTDIHRYLIALYLEDKNAMQIFDIMRTLYDHILQGSLPSLGHVKQITFSKTGRTVDIEKYEDVVDQLLMYDMQEAAELFVLGTPGIVIWDNKNGIGIVIIGFHTADEMLKVINVLAQLS